jgi:hypothetical protein
MWLIPLPVFLWGAVGLDTKLTRTLNGGTLKEIYLRIIEIEHGKPLMSMGLQTVKKKISEFR